MSNIQGNKITVAKGDYVKYTVSKEGYVTVSEMILMDEDKTLNINLEEEEIVFKFTIDTRLNPEDATDRTFRLPFSINPAEYSNYRLNNMTVNWGDGDVSSLDFNVSETTEEYLLARLDHEYATPGIYQISIRGVSNFMNPFSFYVNSYKYNNLKLISLDSSLLKDYITIPNKTDKELQMKTKIFMNCENLKTIHEDLFKYHELLYFNMYSAYLDPVDEFGVFRNCKSLQSIPENIFRYNNLRTPINMFMNCTSLKYVGDIFKTCTLLEDVCGCFQGCENIEKISPNLFANNTNLTRVGQSNTADRWWGIGDGCFYNCKKLTIEQTSETFSTPLFANNTNLQDMSHCFYGCESLVVADDLFGENMSSIRNQSNLKFTSFMKRENYIGENKKSVVPELWNIPLINDDGTEKQIISDGCFDGLGNNIDTIENYNDIPEEWKVSTEENE